MMRRVRPLNLFVKRAESTVDAKASIGLSETDSFSGLADLPLKVNADLDIKAIEKILTDFVSGEDLNIPATGAIEGELSVEIAERKLVATRADLSSTTLAYDGIGVEKIDLTADMEGLHTVAVEGELTLDEMTGLEFGGKLNTETLAYTSNANGKAAVEGKLKELLAKMGMEKDLTAAATFDWSGSGNISESDHLGSVTLGAKGVRYGEAEEIDAELTGEYDNLTIDLSHLEVVSEKLQFEGALKYDGEVLDITDISLKSGELILLEGHAKTPLSTKVFETPSAYFSQEGIVDVDIESSDLKLREILSLFQLEAPTDCILALTLTASGTPSTLDLEGSFTADDIDLNRGDKIAPARTELDLSVKEGLISVTGKIEQSQIQPFTLEGSMAFHPAGVDRWDTGPAGGEDQGRCGNEGEPSGIHRRIRTGHRRN